jgi:hypothetical protein
MQYIINAIQGSRILLLESGRCESVGYSCDALLQASGPVSLRQIAAGLNAAETSTPRDTANWSAVQVQRVLKATSVRRLPSAIAAIAEVVMA